MLTWLSGNNTDSTFAAVASSAFYCADGSVYYTIRDLANGLVHMSENTFNHHVHDETNDFANWIEGCFVPPAREIGSHIRGATREEMIKTLVAIHQAKHVEPHKKETPTSVPAQTSAHQEKKDVTIRREPINLHPAELPTNHTVTKTTHPIQSTAPVQHTKQTVKSADIHPPPLPRSPLHQVHEQRINHIKDMLHTIQMQATVDLVEAKESFITLRTKVWRDLDENERKAVIPQLREVYEFLLKKH